MAEEFVSLNPETFTEGGGGLINDVDGEFSGFVFDMRDLKGGSNLNPYLCASFTAEGESYDMYWSCGGSANWEVGAGGKSLKAKGTQKGINKGSNLGIFLASLYNAGFPKDKLGNDISILDGMQAHIIRVPEPERKGLNRPAAEPGREKTIITVSKINKLPWDKSKGAKPAGAKPKAPAASEALESEVVGIILTALADNPEGIAKKDIIKSVVAQAESANRGAAMQMANNDSWLKGRTEWAYDNGVVKMP
jgi:hypothetical protein